MPARWRDFWLIRPPPSAAMVFSRRILAAAARCRRAAPSAVGGSQGRKRQLARCGRNHAPPVAVVVIAATVRAEPMDKPSGARPSGRTPCAARGHLVAQRAGHDHQVRLTWAGTEQHAEAVDVVTRRAGVHHLDRAASQTETSSATGTGLGPVDQRVSRGDEALFEDAFDTHFEFTSPVFSSSFPNPGRPFSIRRRSPRPGCPGTHDAQPAQPAIPIPSAPRPKGNKMRFPGRTG